jgi:IclR family mhp operon transcriptional activator
VLGIRSLDRGIQVLLRVNAAGTASLHELHQATGTPKATLLRILKTLEGRGMVWRRIADGRYCASHHLTSRGRYAARTEALVRAASPVLDELCSKILWPSDLAVPRRDCMEICETNRPLAPIHLNRKLIGLRVPMLHSAHGRAYLAFCGDEQRAALLANLRKSRRAGNEAASDRARVERIIEQTRAQGYGTRDSAFSGQSNRSKQQPGDGLLAIAVPVFNATQVVGTVNILWVARVATTTQMAARHLEDLRAAARRIGDSMSEGQPLRARSHPAPGL